MHQATRKALELLAARLRAGEWPENGFLPSERRLCTELEVGRGSLNAIFRELAQQRLITLEPGRGARVMPAGPGALRQIMVIENSSVPVAQSAEHLRLLDNISQCTAAQGIGMSLAFVEAGADPEPFLERYARNEFQGMLLIERSDLLPVGRLLRSGIPTVVVNHETGETAPSSRIDFRAVGRLAGRELIDAGCRRIGVLGAPVDRFFGREILAGFKGALAEEDIELTAADVIFWNHPVDREIDAPENRAAAAARRLRELLASPARPQAFFAVRDWRAAKIYDACRSLGLAIPADLSVISYDDLSWDGAAAAGLSTISEPVDQLVRGAVAMLRSWTESCRRPENVIVRGELVARGSIAGRNGSVR